MLLAVPDYNEADGSAWGDTAAFLVPGDEAGGAEAEAAGEQHQRDAGDAVPLPLEIERRQNGL